VKTKFGSQKLKARHIAFFLATSGVFILVGLGVPPGGERWLFRQGWQDILLLSTSLVLTACLLLDVAFDICAKRVGLKIAYWCALLPVALISLFLGLMNLDNCYSIGGGGPWKHTGISPSETTRFCLLITGAGFAAAVVLAWGISSAVKALSCGRGRRES